MTRRYRDNNASTSVFAIFLAVAATLSLLSSCSTAQTSQDDDDDDNPLALSESAKSAHMTVCRDSSLYTCVFEQYQRDIQTVSEEGDFECITFSDGATLCPSGTTYKYNSAPFEAECARTNCGKTFNYYDYKCRANLPGSGGQESQPANTLETALHEAYEACLGATAEYKRD